MITSRSRFAAAVAGAAVVVVVPVFVIGGNVPAHTNSSLAEITAPVIHAAHRATPEASPEVSPEPVLATEAPEIQDLTLSIASAQPKAIMRVIPLAPKPKPKPSVSPAPVSATQTKAPEPVPTPTVQASVAAPAGDYSCSALEALWEQAGGSSGTAFIAAEIAMAESSGDPNAISPTDDYGLWQINASWGSLAALDPLANAEAAVQISDDGTNWSPWTTYQTGAYEGLC